MFSVLDATVTRMGSRRLRNWLLHPLLSVEHIRQRQEAVAELVTQHRMREELPGCSPAFLTWNGPHASLPPLPLRDLAALQISLTRYPAYENAYIPQPPPYCRASMKRWTAGDIEQEIRTLLEERAPWRKKAASFATASLPSLTSCGPSKLTAAVG